ncbi:DNA sulfur modification protein DndD [uncultured Litoreibacter sp.]|uniref:DNA sulfur modification protein DndD n=1 Tax=uncultured Litoreibacter sp. TaxID=1392394 RepID=UPI002627EC9C|nr:DNA sulfur modification protein DndD [uncultured Litoreibacter sp.]
MILHSLRVHNFGLYGGTHEFDLSPDAEANRPVVLVVGHNGSGKTTFLEAVRLALYGKRSLGPRVGQSEYDAHLLRRITNTASERHAFVELCFTSHHLGTKDTYVVRREWASRGNSVVEALEFSRNDTLVEDIPREDWNHYLEDMIPAGVSQLFFFDGEKIQDIADDQGSSGLTEAIKSLLGLDIIDQLRGDLALYKARTVDNQDGPDIEAIKRDLEIARTDLVICEEHAASLSSKRTQLARRSEAAQRFFEQEGGSVAISRDALSEKLKSVETEFNKLVAALKSHMNGIAPFALAPKLVASYLAQVERAKDTHSGKAVEKFVSAFVSSVTEKQNQEISWTEDHLNVLKSFVETSQELGSVLPLGADPEWILGKFENLTEERVRVATLSANLASCLQSRAQLREQLKNFRPGAAATAFEELKKSEHELGGLESELARANAEAARLRTLEARLDKEYRKARDAIFALSRARERTDLATRSQDALDAYEKRIAAKRLASLSQHFVEAFNGLVTRKRLVHKVQVDPETFGIRLFRDGGDEILSSDLSAGERQLFAISMLWALGRTSGRELPMIIDTPLSRLDHTHRTKLMSDYLPQASAQVIMLCTDTELTPDLADLVAPHVNRRFDIGVVDEGRITAVSPKPASLSSDTEEEIYAH